VLRRRSSVVLLTPNPSPLVTGHWSLLELKLGEGAEILPKDLLVVEDGWL
jgi:hypothetical protein